MKILSVLIIASTILGFSSCAKKIAADDSKNNKDSISNLSRFIVDFYSIGQGPEGDQIGKLEGFVSDYSKRIGKKIVYESNHYGREGEVNYCFKLKEFETADQITFIKAAKDVLRNAKWVHFSEFAVCRQGRTRSQ